MTTKNYNKVVAGLIKQVKETDGPVGAVRKHLAELAGDASRMPTDMQISEAFARRKVYGTLPAPRLRYILEQLELRHTHQVR